LDVADSWCNVCVAFVYVSTADAMSADLQWMVIRNSSCFLMKRKSVKHFSKVCKRKFIIYFVFVMSKLELVFLAQQILNS